MNADKISKLVESEIARIKQLDLAQAVRDHIVTPRMEMRDWDYGEDGEQYACWIVCEDTGSNQAVAFCEQGFAPPYSWGTIHIDGEFSSMGPDAAWYISLEQAVRGSSFWEGQNPSGYEVL